MSKDRMRAVLLEHWFPQIEQALPQMAGHPALIGWRHFDEAPAKHVPNAVLLAGRIRELDPYHNVYFSTEGGADLPIAPRGGELFSHDCFMNDAGSMANGYHKSARLKAQCARNNRVPNVAAQNDHSGQLRPLRYEEMRCQSFLALIGGAKSLEWFSDRPHFLGPWNDQKRVARQIRRISPVLLEPDIEQGITVEQEGARTVYTRLFRKGTDYTLMAAQSTVRPTSAHFKIRGLKENSLVREFYQGTTTRSGPDGLTLEFGPYEVLVYQMRLDR